MGFKEVIAVQGSACSDRDNKAILLIGKILDATEAGGEDSAPLILELLCISTKFLSCSEKQFTAN